MIIKRQILFFIEKSIKFLQLQLFISLLSFPIIGAWGLPISTMAIVGNLLFTPWVILFVAVSTIIFFTELVYIPNDYFIIALEYITKGWYYCLAWGKKSWVIGIPDDLVPLTYLLAIFALLAICHKRWGQLLESTFLLALLYISFFSIWYCTVPINSVTCLTKGKATLSLVSNNRTIILYDNDYLRRIRSAESWVEYTLIPVLTKNTGTITIDIIWLNSFSPKVIPVLIYLIDYALIRTIKIPYFTETLTRDEWREFFKMYEKAEKNGVTIKRNSAHLHCIYNDKDHIYKNEKEKVFLIKN